MGAAFAMSAAMVPYSTDPKARVGHHPPVQPATLEIYSGACEDTRADVGGERGTSVYFEDLPSRTPAFNRQEAHGGYAWHV